MKYKHLAPSALLLMFASTSQSLSATKKQLHYLLTSSTAPSSLMILQKPPKHTSVRFSSDQAYYHAGYALKGGKRWKLAQRDAVYGVKPLARAFDRAFGTNITLKNTPATYRILQEIMHDESLVTASAKNHYMRTRPFVFFHQHSCTPKDEQYMKTKSGSYPSGHTTRGWATALVLAEINPERQKQTLKRGYSYGQSRVICGAHWQSDVDAGRITGAALDARLHANPQFQRWIQTAKKEIND